MEWFFEGLEPPGGNEVAQPAAALMRSPDGAQMALAMAQLSPSLRRKVLAVVRSFLPEYLPNGLPEDLDGVD